MRHDIVLQGYGCRLRPVGLNDAAFIVDLRNQPFAQGTIHSTDPSVEKQQAWIERYLERNRDYYWIVESLDNGEAVGAVGFYDITEDGREGMPGRLVVMPQTKFNIFAPLFLIYDYFFSNTPLQRIIMDVVASNKKVVRFHKIYGARMVNDVPARYADTELEVGVPLVWFEVTKEMWFGIRETWAPILASF